MMKCIARLDLGGVSGADGMTQQLQQLSYDGGPTVGSSRYQPPGASYHMTYGGWKHGSASSWSTVDNKTGKTIQTGTNP